MYNLVLRRYSSLIFMLFLNVFITIPCIESCKGYKYRTVNAKIRVETRNIEIFKVKILTFGKLLENLKSRKFRNIICETLYHHKGTMILGKSKECNPMTKTRHEKQTNTKKEHKITKIIPTE